jgi:hypothetical protein
LELGIWLRAGRPNWNRNDSSGRHVTGKLSLMGNVSARARVARHVIETTIGSTKATSFHTSAMRIDWDRVPEGTVTPEQ